jgi:Arc/MetJ-type ribon-helix-helix transcriptional regulator
MGDDEGAQFWEGVYGQPIHKYPNGTLNEHTGELEQMNDEDYAQYVRRKMWEKSREGIEAAREEEQKRKARARAEQQERQEAPTATAELESGFIFDFEIDASLSRGRRRKEKKRWQELWEQYLKRWEELQSLSNNASDTEGFKDLHLRNKIPWPVESGKRKDLAPEEIDRFMRKVTESQDNEGKSASELLSAVLKVERVRWHPDKIQQRYGFMQIDDLTMRGVTATFQVLDRMWNDLREVKKP